MSSSIFNPTHRAAAASSATKSGAVVSSALPKAAVAINEAERHAQGNVSVAAADGGVLNSCRGLVESIAASIDAAKAEDRAAMEALRACAAGRSLFKDGRPLLAASCREAVAASEECAFAARCLAAAATTAATRCRIRTLQADERSALALLDVTQARQKVLEAGCLVATSAASACSAIHHVLLRCSALPSALGAAAGSSAAVAAAEARLLSDAAAATDTAVAAAIEKGAAPSPEVLATELICSASAALLHVRGSGSTSSSSSSGSASVAAGTAAESLTCSSTGAASLVTLLDDERVALTAAARSLSEGLTDMHARRLAQQDAEGQLAVASATALHAAKHGALNEAGFPQAHWEALRDALRALAECAESSDEFRRRRDALLQVAASAAGASAPSPAAASAGSASSPAGASAAQFSGLRAVETYALTLLETDAR